MASELRKESKYKYLVHIFVQRKENISGLSIVIVTSALVSKNQSH